MIPLSYPVSRKTPLFPGTPALTLSRRAEEGQVATSTKLCLDTHSGTHLDVPCHFCPGGPSVKDYPPYIEIRSALCIDVPASGGTGLTGEMVALPPRSEEAEALLIRTGMHHCRREDPQRYAADHPFLLPSFARWLLDLFPRLRMVGIDCVSVAHPDHGPEAEEVHTTLLCRPSPVLILEDLDLSDHRLVGGTFTLVVLPMFHDRLDGTPVAALAHLPRGSGDEAV
ncbi:MAG: cyclase family protein [Methanomassiliicoccus sp.]|nr:cyclase family protein [Methanomassiliicoccus sp.]